MHSRMPRWNALIKVQLDALRVLLEADSRGPEIPIIVHLLGRARPK
jgi:hypothetical protein